MTACIVILNLYVFSFEHHCLSTCSGLYHYSGATSTVCKSLQCGVLQCSVVSRCVAAEPLWLVSHT
jgi:hypothetical protein